MANSDFQRHSFLGGEVSPSLYERADMEKFGKWFSQAENIRFRETGAFRNRYGFVKVADTKHNSAGQTIKLLSFAFNDEESFLVELGPSYARFFRNGQPIMSGNIPYELETPLLGFDDRDLKYAQAGDTIFITHPTYGIYELARLQVDGSNWEWRKFNADILPMKEENEDKSKTVSISSYTQDVKTISLLNPDTSTYLNVSFTFDNAVVYTAESVTLSELYNGITEAIGSDYRTSLSGTTLTIARSGSLGTVPDFSINFSTNYIMEQQLVDSKTNSAVFECPGQSYTVTCSYSGWQHLDAIYVKTVLKDSTAFDDERDISSPSVSTSAQMAAGFGACSKEVRYGTPFASRVRAESLGANVSTGTASISYTMTCTEADYATSSYTARASGSTNMILYGHNTTNINHSFTYNSVASSTSTDYYLLTTTDWTIDNLIANDCILVKHAIDAQQLTAKYESTGTFTLGPIKSDGNWRFYTLGNWTGDITIQYSTDNGQTWVDYYKWASQEAKDNPANVNTSGSLTSDDLVLFRVVSVITNTKPDNTSPCQVFFTANSFTVNSYYKILFKNSSTSAVVECIKNDVGLFTNNFQWRLPAFSNAEGWPQTVAFYQNRLFFGKDYIIYGSRSNDFWDFYEPIKLQADDPVTMSLLSQKVNTIRNLLTQRSFFTFTAGGEFGIGSEGALTQSDKYLKPFSANGSAFCNPVLISDVVLFVDKSFNSVRALKYALESDGYEAPDITITLKSLLESERIISSDIIYEGKEALFLSDTGTIWVLKYITDQNVLSWSHWKHAFGKITNICVVPNGAKHDLYVAVETATHKWIEKMTTGEFMDTVEYFAATQDSKVSVTGDHGLSKVILQEGKRYFRTVDANGQIDAPDDTTKPFKVGSAFVSTATLLSPTVQTSDYSQSNYELKNPFKVFFYYLNSYGFKVGVEEDQKEEIEWQDVDSDIDDEVNLTSGKKSVLIPSRFDGSARVSFVQEEPFPMEVADVLIQTDLGGK